MVKKRRGHIPTDLPTPPELVPKHLTKQAFARRLHTLMYKKGWHQAELARQAGLPRDAISTYINARAMPSQVRLGKLADALGVKPDELLPNYTESAIDEDSPAFELRASPGAPHMAWLRVNRLVTMATGAKIAALLEQDRVLDGERGGCAAEV